MPRKRTKTKVFNIKLSEDTLMGFRVASEMVGSNMSNHMNQLMVKAISEQKQANPELFARIWSRLERERSDELVRLQLEQLKRPGGHGASRPEVTPIDNPEEIHDLSDLSRTSSTKKPPHRKKKIS